MQAQLKQKFHRQSKSQGGSYVERAMNAACNDNFTPVGIWLKRLLPFTLLFGGLLLLMI